MVRSGLLSAAVFIGIAAAALLPARLEVAAAHVPGTASGVLAPAPAEPLADDYGSRALLARISRQQAAAARPSSIQDLIGNAFQPLGADAVAWAEQIAWCESKYDPNAVNPDSNAQGLFQFLPSTWAGTPYAASSPFDPAANARAAAWLFQTYGPGQWECQA